MEENQVGVDIVSDVSSLKRSGAEGGEVLDALGAKTDNLTEATQRQIAATREAQKSWFEQSAGIKLVNDQYAVASVSVQKLLDKYDPLGTKLRALQADFAALSNAAQSGAFGTKQDAAIDAAYKGLNDELAKTKGLMLAAGAAGAEGMEKAAGGAMNLGLNTQYARRELMMLGREALTGNFAQMPQTFGSLAAHSNILPALLHPIALGIFAIAAATGGLAVASVLGRKEQNEMNNALALTNDYAGMTRGTMHELAQEMANTGTMTIGTAKGVVTALVSSGQIGAQAIGAVAKLAGDYAAATGKDIDKIAPDMVKLFEDPAKGAETLNKQMHFLSVADQEHIGHLQRIGELGAAQLAFAEKLSGNTPKQVENLGALEKGWDAVKKAASASWDAMLGIGRDDTLEEKLKFLNAELLRAAQSGNNVRAIALAAEIGVLNAKKEQVDATTKEASIVSATTTKQLAAHEEAKKSALYQIKLLEDARTLVQSEPDPALRARRVFEINKQIDDARRAMGAEGRQMQQAEIDGTLKLREITIGMALEANDAQLKLGKISQTDHDATKLALELQKNAVEQIANIQLQSVPGLNKSEQQRLDIALQRLKVEEQSIGLKGNNAAEINEKKFYDDIRKSVDALGKTEIDALDKTLAAQRLHNAEIGKTAEQIALAKQEAENFGTTQLQVEADALRAAAATVVMAQEYKDIYITRANALDIEIAKRKELAGLMGDAAVLEKSSAAAKSSAKEWQKGLDETNRIGREMFTDWENAAKTLGGTLKKALLSAAYEATMKPLVFQVYSSVTGGGASSALGMAGNASSVYQGAGALYGNSLFQSSSAWAQQAGLSMQNASFNLSGDAANTMYDAGTSIYDSAQTIGKAADVFAYASALNSAANGEYGKAAGQALGYYFGGPIGAYIGSMIGDAILPKAGEERSGGRYAIGATDIYGTQGTASAAFKEGPSGGQLPGVDTLTYNTFRLIDNLLTQLGSKAKVTGFQAGSEISQNDRGGVFSGGVLSTGARFGESGAGSNYSGGVFEITSAKSGTAAEIAANFQTDMLQVTVQALQAATDLPKAVSAYLKGVNAESLGNEALGGVLQMTGAIGTLVNTVGDEAASAAIASLTTNFGDLGKALPIYMNALGAQKGILESLKPATEKLSDAQTALATAGIPATVDGLRDYVKGLDQTTQAGQDSLATVVKLGPAWQLVSSAAAQEAATKLQWQQRIDVASGIISQTNMDRQIALAAASSDAARAMMLLAWQTEDEAERNKKNAADRKGIQDQIDSSTMTSTQLYQKQRNALDANGVALSDSNKLLSDQAEAMKRLGFTAGSLSDIIKDGMLGKIKSADVGGQLSDAIIGGVYNSIAGGFADQITQMMMDSLVSPIVNAMATGTSIADAVSTASINAMVTKATDTANALSAIFKDPAFVAAMASIKVSVGSIGASVAGPAAAAYKPYVPAPAPAAATEATTSAADLLNQKLTLQASIFALLGDAAGQAAILEKQHEIALKAADPSLRDLTDQLWGLQAAAQAVKDLSAFNSAVLNTATAINTLNGMSASDNSLFGAQAKANTDFTALNTMAPWITSIAQLSTIDLSKGGDFSKYTLEQQAAITAALSSAAALKTIQTQIAEQIAATKQSWQDKFNILTGAKTQQQIDRAAQLAAVTDAATLAIMNQVFAQEDAKAAAKAATDAMQKLVQELDAVNAFHLSLGDTIQGIKASMKGYDATAYFGGEIDKSTRQMLNATTTEDQLAAAGKVRDAIMGKYNAEMTGLKTSQDARMKALQDEQSARQKVYDEQLRSITQIHDALAKIGDYAKSLLTSDLSPLTNAQKLQESASQYQSVLAAARGGDATAMGNLSGMAGNYLKEARGFYASSQDYSNIFGGVQSALSALGATAGSYDPAAATAAWQTESLALAKQQADLQKIFDDETKKLQQGAIDALTKLDDQTTIWTDTLNDHLNDQAIVFADLKLNTQQIAENTKDLDKRIADAVSKAIAALAATNAAIATAQTAQIVTAVKSAAVVTGNAVGEHVASVTVR